MHDESNSLDDHERQQLRRIEAELERDDPELALALTTSPLRRSIPRLTRRVGRRVGLTAGVCGGAVVLAVGLVLSAPMVGLGGFTLLVVVLGRLFDAGPEVIVARVRTSLGLNVVSRPADGNDVGKSDSGEPGTGRTT